MSDSDSDEESYCYYGKALEPYDEDAFPKKRPISVEEQVAKDAQGRRRFHGAFTGGFSAGFFNTVGSLEGWTPSEFKSSRGDKASSKTQRPEDYMDEEDIGEFGIAPQIVQAKEEFANKKKRKKQIFSDGPIPGEPVLQTLINSGNETVGYLLLRNMGLKPTTHTEETTDTDADAIQTKVYGCEMPRVQVASHPYECAQYPIPDIYNEFLSSPKSNTFGLGYSGLDRSHINLFESSHLVVKERGKKNFSITGQAFGVGAFEHEDDDIYTKDNMSKYDFELAPESSSKKEEVQHSNADSVFEIFVKSKQKLASADYFPPPNIPSSFTGRHKVRRSRFEPLREESVETERRQMNVTIRAKYLGEASEKVHTPSEQQFKAKKPPDSQTPSSDSVVTSETTDSGAVKTKLESLAGFGGLIFDKFVSASQEDSQEILAPVKKTETEHGTQEMRAAAKLKMFGPLTRISFDWQPCSLLCKRFNIAEPLAGESSSQRNRKRTKHLIFEYQKETEDNSIHKPGLTEFKVKTEEVDVAEEEIPPGPKVSEDITTEITTAAQPITESETMETVLIESAPIDLTERVDVARNTDLFKAIFLSSSESESEEENTQEPEDRNITLRNNVLTDQLLPKIKPTKDGILSNVDFTQFKKPETTEIQAQSEAEETVVMESNAKIEDDLTYGPRLPTKVLPSARNESLPVAAECNNVEEWVEKDEFGKQKGSNKHKKKHKKEHKKKHKHRREKKK